MHPIPRAKQICLVAGCTSVTQRAGRCPSHQRPHNWSTNVSARNRNRPGDAASRRSRALARDRFACQRCGSRQQLEVDHIRPVARGGTWALENLRTLCKPCHRNKTSEDRTGL
ncbi:HNH endonuclease signature motif containing protein [Streptomyces olivoreticuli]|uniref:HNH endonuclease n=1 Tax=Streptomyces olivoreticuli TaxID=68246 RepID=UPI00265927E5|nr:HNH endonuclease signature motif containing protein [Streptomyces olivoreticuli]WKK23045.1 HNH endonuclease signature motif containing protein [Streptomyces olivoreticuli]